LVDRFRKQSGASLPKRMGRMKLYYLPFWRFTSQVFCAIFREPDLSSVLEAPDQEGRTDKILSRDWDLNFSAHRSNDLGIATLGMRPDWLELRILTRQDRLEQRGEVLSVETDSSAVRERALESVCFFMERKKEPGDELILRLLEEHTSLIYFPLWVADFVAPEGEFFHVIDGVTKRTLKEGKGCFESRPGHFKGKDKSDQLSILPHRCPNCGWDLPVRAFHVVFPCSNCRRLWKLEEGRYRQVRGEVVKPAIDSEINSSRPATYYPFWVFEIKLGQGKSTSIGEMSELLPSEIGLFQAKNKSQPFLFYVPAFELRNLSKVPDIGRAFVCNQPDLKRERANRHNLKGVFISEVDAKKLAEILWLSLIWRRASLGSNAPIGPTFERGRILWCPFVQEGTFLRDAVVGYSFQKVG